MKKLTILTACAALALPLSAQAGPDAPEHHKGPKAEMWHKIDSNGDKTVTKAEWLAFSEEHFKETDANGDGKLTPDELKAQHEKRRAGLMQHRATRGDKPAK